MTRIDCLATSKRLLNRCSNICLYITSIGLPLALILIVDVLEHHQEPMVWVAFMIFLQVGLFIFHVSGFLFGIVVERWEKEETLEEEQDNPDKV